MGSLLATRLARKVQDTFRFQFSEVCFFTDSSCVLGMLQCDSDTFNEFVGNRVAEIRKNSNIDCWYWVPTDKNPADMGTRPKVEPSDLAAGTDYQIGMDWMRDPVSKWPTRKTFSTPPPEEERRKDRVGVATIMSNSPSPIFSRFRSLSKTVRVMATVIAALDKWRVYRKISSSLETPGEYKVILTPAALETAERYLIASAQEKLELKELEPLLPEVTKVSGVGDVKFNLLLVGGRSKVRYRIGYEADGVPVLPAKHPLSRLYIREAHEIDHGGSTLR